MWSKLLYLYVLSSHMYSSYVCMFLFVFALLLSFPCGLSLGFYGSPAVLRSNYYHGCVYKVLNVRAEWGRPTETEGALMKDA